MVSMCTDIWIDTQSHFCHFSFCRCQFIDDFQFWDRFNIEAKYVIIQTQVNFPVGFSNSGKYYIRCWNSGINGSLNFPSAYTICAETGIFYYVQDTMIYIGFHGIMDMKISYFSLSIYFFQCLAKYIQIVIIKWCLYFIKFLKRIVCFYHDISKYSPDILLKENWKLNL